MKSTLRIFSKGLPFCFLLLGALPAWAAGDCPDGSAPPAEPLAVHAQRLASLAARCGGDADYLAWRGAVLLALGRAGEAADLLERALLIAPEHPGARRDYARALLALGERAAAHTLLAGLALTPAPTYPAVWQGQGRLRAAIGHDSNLNRATAANALTLTLPGGALDLPLAPESRARAGSFYRLEGELAARRALSDGAGLELLGRLTARRTPAAHADLDQVDFLALLRWPRAPGGEWSAHLGVDALRWQGETLQRNLRGGLRVFAAQVGGCRPGGGVDLEMRRHPGQEALDHHSLQADAVWLCEGARPWLVQLAGAREFASARPGGEAWRLGARVLGHWPLASSRLEGEARLNLRREDGPYSPLLENGQRLASATLALRLEWRRPLAPQLELGLTLEAERQRASLALFDLDRHAVALGLHWFF